MTIYPLTKSIIRSWVGEKSFSRGQQYYNDGAITNPWVQGDVLKAKCWGSSPHPYRVWVRLGPDGIEGGECSCPVGSGGYGFANAAYDIVLTQSEPVEKVEMVTWSEDELARVSSSDDFSTKWRVEAFGRLLLKLQSDSLTDEQLIQLCRRTGQLNVMVERLLQLSRVDDAISDTQTASDYELLALADLFVAHGHYTIAEELVEERAQASKDTRLDNWLKNQAVNSDDWHKAVGHAEKKF